MGGAAVDVHGDKKGAKCNVVGRTTKNALVCELTSFLQSYAKVPPSTLTMNTKPSCNCDSRT